MVQDSLRVNRLLEFDKKKKSKLVILLFFYLISLFGQFFIFLNLSFSDFFTVVPRCFWGRAYVGVASRDANTAPKRDEKRAKSWCACSEVTAFCGRHDDVLVYLSAALRTNTLKAYTGDNNLSRRCFTRTHTYTNKVNEPDKNFGTNREKAEKTKKQRSRGFETQTGGREELFFQSNGSRVFFYGEEERGRV